jgi:hypothetical protein
MFLEPIKRDNKLILIYKNPPVKNIVDVRIKSINKLANNTGYIFNIYIAPSNNSDIIRELVAFDKEIMISIEDNSVKWFDRQFDMSEITELYHKSFCNQTKTIGVILTNKQVKNMMYNNKVFQDIDDIVNILADDNIAKKSFVNITMEYYGLYIYSETTSNKWIIRKIDISNINEDDNNVSTEELIDNFQHRIYNIKKKCNDKIGELSKNIDNIRDNMKTIDELLADLKKSSESTNININYFLNKLNTLILNQEENIK